MGVRCLRQDSNLYTSRALVPKTSVSAKFHHAGKTESLGPHLFPGREDSTACRARCSRCQLSWGTNGKRRANWQGTGARAGGESLAPPARSFEQCCLRADPPVPVLGIEPSMSETAGLQPASTPCGLTGKINSLCVDYHRMGQLLRGSHCDLRDFVMDHQQIEPPVGIEPTLPGPKPGALVL